MKIVRTGGGWRAVWYAWHAARKSGGVIRFLKAMSSRNACKTCALGMGGQRGGMVDEGGHFPEVCKKSMQAMAADMQDGVTPAFFEKYGLRELAGLSSRELEGLQGERQHSFDLSLAHQDKIQDHSVERYHKLSGFFRCIVMSA